MSVFADSSALVKLYADEGGHEPVRALGVLVISQLARVEVPAAIWRKHRMGELGADHARLLVQEFEADYYPGEDEQPRFLAITAGGPVLDAAARLAAVHGLRAYDAVQLASARAARAADGDCATFAAYDSRLSEAAAAEGFTPFPS